MTFSDLKAKVDIHCNDLRSLQYLMTLDGMDDLFSANSNQIEALAKEAGCNPDRAKREVALEQLRLLLRRHMRADETLADLRLEASRLGIERYSRMDKETLLAAVEQRRRSNGQSGNQGNFQPCNGRSDVSAQIRCTPAGNSV